MYTIGSVFSGIGGIDLGFAAAGFDVRWQVEIDPYCRKVLKQHGKRWWKRAVRFADVRDCGDGRKHRLTRVDGIVGGFPCQDISIAGKGVGLSGARSGLWWELARIIGELRPRFVMLENVAAITNRGGVEVVGALTAMGYDCRWGVISASDAGAPHKRERWWLVGYTNGVGRDAARNVEAGQGFKRWDGQAHQQTGRDIVCSAGAAGGVLQHAGGERLEKRKSSAVSCKLELVVGRSGVAQQKRIHKSGVGRAVDGLSSRMDALISHEFPAYLGAESKVGEPEKTIPARIPHHASRIKALGNAVVPQIVCHLAREILFELDST